MKQGLYYKITDTLNKIRKTRNISLEEKEECASEYLDSLVVKGWIKDYKIKGITNKTYLIYTHEQPGQVVITYNFSYEDKDEYDPRNYPHFESPKE